MREAGRAAAAIEILTDIEQRRRPAADALKDWGLAHRFAGSGDRAAIGNLVHDALRKRLSHAARMGADTPRAAVLATLRDWGLSADAIAALCDPEQYGPAAISIEERAALERDDAPAPDFARADTPEWLWPRWSAQFADDGVREGQAMAARAPVDLRVNTLKATAEKAAKALSNLHPQPGAFAPHALRLPASHAAGRAPAVESDPAFQKGWIEIQDEASQIAAALAGAKPGMQVADVCAGAGGKTLALAAAMENRGQIHAYDSDKRRLAPIFDRIRRAGVRNVQVRPAGGGLDDLHGRMDLVFVDAPCTGSGVWRRRPDAKWRLRPNALEERKRDQIAVLDEAAPLVKPGGRLVYATCSLFAEENEAQVAAFLARWPMFALIDAETLAVDGLGAEAGMRLLGAARRSGGGLLLSPARTGTDGFFVCGVVRGED